MISALNSSILVIVIIVKILTGQPILNQADDDCQ